MRTRKRRKRQLRGKARLISASIVCDNEKCVEIDEFVVTRETQNSKPVQNNSLNNSCCSEPDCQVTAQEPVADIHALSTHRLSGREKMRAKKPVSKRQQDFVAMFPEETVLVEAKAEGKEVPKKIGFFGFIKKLFGF